MRRDASELAHRLAREAEAVCRRYLSNGKREGRYWLVGDVYNTPGRSMFVRLQDSTKGSAGKWTDAATGEHGDLLDIIRHSLGLRDFREVAEEARRFLKLPRTESEPVPRLPPVRSVPAGSREAARRLFAISGPIEGTMVETYLRRRGIARVHHGGSVRFHPRCYYRSDEHVPTETWPAMIACVTDLDGRITGVHRTWLDPDGFDRIRLGKAPIDTPRRAMGDLLGNAVCFGAPDDDVLVAGEGIETMLSLRCALPTLPMAAALSANHLAAMLLSSSLRRLYIARDADAAGDMVQATLLNRAQAAGIEAIPLSPRLGDFNEDLHIFGLDALRAALRLQLVPEDVSRFLLLSATVVQARLASHQRRQLGRAAAQCRRGRDLGLLEGDRTASGPGRQWLRPAIFRRPCGPLHREAKQPASAILRWRFGPPLRFRVLARSARRLSDRHEGRDGRGQSGKGPLPMSDHDDTEQHTPSPSDLVLNELQLFGYRPFDDQPDPRPLPEGKMIAGAVADIFDALVATLGDTRLEPDLPDLLWSTVNLFHRATDRIGRQLDDNEQAQRKSQREQNGSEVRSVELERLTAEGITLIERRNCLELFRDQAVELFEVHTGSSWRPRSGSLVNHRTLTAAMIDSRDFIAAKRRAETEVMLPPGPKVALTGGFDCNDHRLIWDRLDKVHAKHPDMVLIHGGSPKGAELIASKWATNRKVPQIAFKPDWTKHANAAPFKRNDAMLELLPIGVMHFPGTGIQDNLADKARRLGIPVWKFGDGA